jgi:hypothetical protein
LAGKGVKRGVYGLAKNFGRWPIHAPINWHVLVVFAADDGEDRLSGGDDAAATERRSN